MGGFAWVTLATNDSYSLGALVLAHSLRRVNTAHQLVVLITPGVTPAMRTQLSAVFNQVKLVDVLDSKDAANLSLLARPELGITFTKLHCWKLTQFEKCVFLDADTLVLQNSDELFDREEFSAAPDAGWPDCFNSGVFVYKPNDDTFKALIDFAMVHGSFDGGDQGLLNLFFNEWPTKDIKKHLPFVYNMCSTATYSYLPAFKQYGHGLKIVHFIGTAKPWLQPFNTETGLASVSGESQHVVQFVQLWWDLFCTHVHSSLSTDMARARLSSSYDFGTVPQPTSSEFRQNYLDTGSSSPPPTVQEQNFPQSFYNPWDDDDLLKDDKLDESGENLCHSDVEQHYRHVVPPPESWTHNHVESSHNQQRQDSYSSQSQDSRSDPSDSGVSVESVEYCDRFSGQDRVAKVGHTSKQDSFSKPVFSVTNVRNSGLGTEPSVGPRTFIAPFHIESSPAIGTSRDEPISQFQKDQQINHEKKSDAGLAAALSTVTLGSPLSAEHSALQEHLRRQGWEQGNIDYMGKDSFANIWQKICQTLAGGPQSQAPAPTVPETPAPVAPVAAPVYVSSVEISPTGPIDTSPPASYAPVSAPKPVAASDSKATSASAEPATEKSPSVTELVPSESAPPAALDTPSQPSADKVPEPTTTPAPATTPEISSTTSAPVATSQETIPPPVLPSTPDNAAPAAIPLGPTVLATDTSVPPTQTQPPSPLSAAGEIQLLAPTPAAPAPTEASATTEPLVCPLPVSAPTESPVCPMPVSTPAESPVCPMPVLPPTESPVCPMPVATPTESPVCPMPVSSPTEPLVCPLPVSSTVPTPPEPLVCPMPVPTPTESPVCPMPVSTPIESPVCPMPVSTPSESSPVCPIPISTPTESPVCPMPVPSPAPQAPTEPLPTPPQSPASAPVESATPAPAIAIPPIATLPPAEAQPGTPTVTGPTPPTSPPAAPQEPSLAKLQTDTEIPSTPPAGAGASGTDPSEPPVPPKRKGGAKAQEAKAPKGKPAKGKK